MTLVVADIQESFPEAALAVHPMDGMPLALQAALFSNASLVIQAHGAALGTLLPHCRQESV